jgi:hypothetical protein
MDSPLVAKARANPKYMITVVAVLVVTIIAMGVYIYRHKKAMARARMTCRPGWNPAAAAEAQALATMGNLPTLEMGCARAGPAYQPAPAPTSGYGLSDAQLGRVMAGESPQ